MTPAFAAIALSAAAAVGAAGQDESPLDALTAIEGYWEIDPGEASAEEIGEFTCQNAPLRIDVSDDRRRYTSVRAGHEETTATAPILAELPDFPAGPAFVIQYDGEARLDPDGAPVVWLLVMAGPDGFYWIRRDWLGDGQFRRTALRRRCPETNIS